MNTETKAFKINIVYGDELYTDTPRLVDFLREQSKFISTFPIDVTKSSQIVSLFESNGPLDGGTTILLIESSTNPSGHMFDPSLIVQLRRLSKQLIVIVDNTWLTDTISNPLRHDADIVVMSLTKYYSGGHAICGAVVGNQKPLHDEIDMWMRVHGLHVSPHNASVVLRYIQTMDDRIRASSALTVRVVAALKQRRKVVSVCHPSLPEHPSFALAAKYFQSNLFPSVFTFAVKGSKTKVLKALKSATSSPDSIEHKTSFGSPMTRSDPWPKKVDELVMCRIAIGHADQFDRILKGLDQILQRCP